jgi:hypothetical protein
MVMSPFTGNIDDSKFKLVIHTSDEIDLWTWKIMAGPLLPFTNQAWLVTCALVVYMSFVLQMIEGDIVLEESEGNTLGDHLARDLGVAMEEHACLKFIDRFCAGVAQVLYNSVLGLTQGMHPGEAVTFPGRVVSAGFTVFGLIFIATYTASTAAAMFLGQHAGPVLTLGEIERTGAKLCIRTAMASSFLLRECCATASVYLPIVFV